MPQKGIYIPAAETKDRRKNSNHIRKTILFREKSEQGFIRWWRLEQCDIDN